MDFLWLCLGAFFLPLLLLLIITPPSKKSFRETDRN